MSRPNLLPEVSPETLARFQAQRMNLVDEVVERSLKQSDLIVQHGARAREVITVGLDYTTRALGVAMQVHNSEMLRQQLSWANDRLPHNRVEPQHILVLLRILVEVVRESFSPADSVAVDRYVSYLTELQDSAVESSRAPG
jgi:hypothetical protein